MSNPVFVGRENELSKLKTYLDGAAAGKTQVVFISGEAGSGKSTLIGEFVRRAEAADPKLISALGECNAQTGIADPYLPFRQVLTTLTAGKDPAKTAKETDHDKKISRWKEFVAVSTKTLIMLGPDLVGIFIPGGALITRVGTTIAFNSNVAGKLSDKVGKKLGERSPKVDPALDQQKIFEQYASVLKTLAKERTIILVLDDLQWADNGSIALLFHLSRQLKDSRLLLVGAYRPDDVALGRDGGRHPLEGVLNELKRYYGDIVIDLSHAEAGESRRFVDELVDAEPNALDRGFRDELFAHTSGHPLFTVEMLRDLQECGSLVRDAQDRWVQANPLDWNDLPARIEGVFGERLARLPAELHETLRIGSVVGHEFAAQVVGRVQKADERDLVRSLSRELEKRYLLVIELPEIKVGSQFLSPYRFNHSLLQQYLYGELGAGERRMLHGEIAGILETIYGEAADQIALQLAHHYEAAGNEAKAVTYLACAGDAAFKVYAYDEAIAAYTRALELSGKVTVEAGLLRSVYLRRGRALELSSRYQPAMQNYQDMGSAAQKLGDRSMELASRIAASTLYCTPTPLADAVKGQALAEETLALARELGDRASEAKALWNLQLVNLLQNQTSQAIDYGEKSLSIASELNLREQMAYVLSDLGWAYAMACQFDKATERLEQGAVLWKELGNQPMLGSNLNSSMWGYYFSGRYDQVLKVAEQAYQLTSAIKEVWNQSSARNFQGRVRLERGEIDRGLEALEDSIRLASQGNILYQPWYRAMLFQAYADLGAADIFMSDFAAQRVANRDIANVPMRTGWLTLYARFELACGDLDTAEATLAECKPDAPPWVALLRLAGCRLALARSDIPGGYALADEVVEVARKNNLGCSLPEALYLKGKCLALQGRSTEAKSTLEEAQVEAEKPGSRLLLWQILAARAGLEPDGERSAALKTEARQIVEDIARTISRQDLKAAFIRLAEASAVLV